MTKSSRIPTPLPDDRLPPFTVRFSQRSLADYQACKRRFQLRYLERLIWPAPFSAADHELEDLMELGQAFHQAVHQHLVGVDPGALVNAHQDRRLKTWWQAFETHVPPRLPVGHPWPESSLSVPLGKSWLVARLDLLIVSPSGKATIFDWKTGHPRHRSGLAQHMQTHVYPFVLAEAGHSYNSDEPILPEDITMIYWHTQAPQHFVEFPYSRAAHERNQRFLQTLIDEIVHSPKDGFPKTDNLVSCQRCNFRAYCGRDVEPAPATELVDEEVDLLLEEAAPYEIEEDL